MAAKAADDQSVKFWSLPQAPGIELLRAKYTTQNFSRHIHDGYAFAGDRIPKWTYDATARKACRFELYCDGF